MRLKNIWQQWKVEVIAITLGCVGFFLMVEQLEIRATIWATISQLFQGATEGIEELFASLQISNLFGLLLLIIGAVLLVRRLIMRLREAPSLTVTKCPRCNGSITRTHRHSLDHLISILVPIRRYKCNDQSCGWRGIRVSRKS
jgi:hypothetical protein